MGATVLGRFLERVGRSKRDLMLASGVKRYATVHDAVEGNSTPRPELAMMLANGTVMLAAGTEVPPVAPAEILGVADWTPEAAE